MARKEGIGDTRGIINRWKRELTAAIWNRVACMLHKCMEKGRSEVGWGLEEADVFDDDGYKLNQQGRRWIAAN